MTISRSEIARVMLDDVVAEWATWPNELETITGYSWDQYRALNQKLFEPGAMIDQADEALLRQAAIQFFGYPGMTTGRVETVLGAEWKQIIDETFLSESKK